MVMHENSQKFLKFDTDIRKLVLSNHDLEFTLFFVESSCDILQNDYQILKSDQPIKLKLANFSLVYKIFYISICFPYLNLDKYDLEDYLEEEEENNFLY